MSYTNIFASLIKSAILALLGLCTSFSQEFSSGSTGEHGALLVSSDTTLNLPPDGIFHFTTFEVNQGVTVTFRKNETNTPVRILASGAVRIEGTIDASGQDAQEFLHGEGGPGGFDGAFYRSGSDGFGPGAGRGGGSSDGGHASYGSLAPHSQAPNLRGGIYGNSLLIPLIGGSGGGGTTSSASWGGGGGGGAILIASDIAIAFHPTEERESYVLAEGGSGDRSGSTVDSGYGSGGAIRLLAPMISGKVNLSTDGSFRGGDGRLRIDCLNRSELELESKQGRLTIGKEMYVFPEVQPQLSIVEAAGRSIDSLGTTSARINLGADESTNQPIRLRASGFSGAVDVVVAVIPERGSASRYSGQIDMDGNEFGEITINIDVAGGAVSHIQAWTQ